MYDNADPNTLAHSVSQSEVVVLGSTHKGSTNLCYLYTFGTQIDTVVHRFMGCLPYSECDSFFRQLTELEIDIAHALEFGNDSGYLLSALNRRHNPLQQHHP